MSDAGDMKDYVTMRRKPGEMWPVVIGNVRPTGTEFSEHPYLWIFPSSQTRVKLTISIFRRNIEFDVRWVEMHK